MRLRSVSKQHATPTLNTIMWFEVFSFTMTELLLLTFIEQQYLQILVSLYFYDKCSLLLSKNKV